LRRLFRSRVAILAAGGLLGAMLVATTAAVALNGGTGFTGCLTKGGALMSLAEGDSPLEPCKGTQEQVSLSSAAAVSALKADVDALLAVIQIHPVTGAVTIASPEDLMLDSGDGDMVMIMDDTEIEGDAMLMEDTTVMGETMLEGDTMLMEDATVMGETMLEGDAMLMAEADVMGDATFEGNVVLADTTATVDASGELTPVSSSMTITGFDGLLPLLRITPADVDGTILEIHFGTGGGGGFTEAVVSCSSSCPGLGGRNIELKGRSGAFFFEVGDTLKLVSEGPTWVEVSRSSGHAEAFNVTETVFVPRGAVRAVDVMCSDPPDGREDALLLTASVNFASPTDLVVEHERIFVNPFTGEETFFVVVRNTATGFGLAEEYEVALRCLSV